MNEKPVITKKRGRAPIRPFVNPQNDDTEVSEATPGSSLNEALGNHTAILMKDVDALIDTQVKLHLAKEKEKSENQGIQLKIDAIKKDTFLTDQAFITQLLAWGIAPKYMKVFRDEDNKFNRQQVWKTIREKGRKIK